MRGYLRPSSANARACSDDPEARDGVSGIARGRGNSTRLRKRIVGGVVVPAGVPQAIIARLNKEVNAVLTLPHVREKFAAFGVELQGGPPEVFASQIRKDAAKWADVIKRAGVKTE